MLCDDEAVAKNSSDVESSLNRKHSAVAHHFTGWNVAAKVCLVGWIETEKNIADVMTKTLPEVKRNELFHDWTY